MPTKPNPTSARWTEDDARAVLASQKTSGLSIFAFAKREGLDADRLYRWTERLRYSGSRARATKPAPAQFIKIRTPIVPAGIDVHLRGGHSLRVPSGFDADSLRQLILLLEEGAQC